MKDFSKIYKEDLDIVGKKAVEIGELIRLGIPIPDGFVITTSFFKKFLDQTGISEKIKEVQKLDHPSISESIEKLLDPVKKQIVRTHIPNNLISELYKFYKKLVGPFKDPSLNIFSSSPSSNKSIIFENVKGDANFIIKVKEIWVLQLHNPVGIVVQKNIKSKTKGKMITNDPLIDKKFVSLAKKIQKHFYFPKVLDYVINKDKIYITGVSPFTGKVEQLQNQVNKKMRKVLVKGVSINPGIVTGPVKVLRENYDRIQILKGEIIVLPRLNLLTYGRIKRAKAVVVDAALTSSYDRMIYRKNLKIPTIEGAKNATKILQNGNIVTVNGISGEIYRGSLI